jgi:arsenite methyltransferase
METETEIKAAVRTKYGAIASAPSGACGCCGDGGADLLGEAYHELAGHVAEADLGLGCGLPTRHADIREGQIVLDLGSGAGNDVFVARPLVGGRGRVIGVDMTAAMVERASANAQKLGYANVEFRLGELEALPVADASVDVVISNCVLNLVPDKAGAFAEIFRVLRPGAHFCISDIVTSGPLPEAIRAAAELHVGCVAGAMEQDRYLEVIRTAGFSDVRIAESKTIELPDAVLTPHLDRPAMAAFRAADTWLLSVTVLGTKPPAACCGDGCCR